MSGKKFVLREGFWRNESDKSTKNLPRVRARQKAFLGQRDFLGALHRMEAHNPNTISQHSKGWSDCRCCGRKNGSVQYKLTALGVTWEWPAGYSHYVEDHNVRPSLAFQEWILAVSKALPGTHEADEDD